MANSCENCQYNDKKRHWCKYGFGHKHIDPNTAFENCCQHWRQEFEYNESKNDF